jgi:hypothetical protein
MKALNAAALAAAAATALIGWSVPAQAQGDAAIRQKIVRASIDSYSGSCPCPYNTDRAGRSCGRRSAYSRPGGYSPKCYASDVTAAEVKAYRGGR